MDLKALFRHFPLIFSFLFIIIGDQGISVKKGMISIENLRSHVESLHFDRNPHEGYAKMEEAAHYIKREFLKAGLDVQEDCFQWSGQSYKNIVADKKGVTSPHRVYILGAHYDTVPGSPGADDNASAIAVLLEVARNIQPLHLESTVRFIAFSLEEYDFVGSTHYVESLKKGREKILGMISLEMVGFTGSDQNYPPYIDPKYYPNVGDFIGIVGNERSRELLEQVYRSFRTHIPQLPTEFFLVPGRGEGMEEVTLSDHRSFWEQDLPALLVTDTAFLRNPNYHLPSDTLKTLDFEFMEKVATGIYSSVVELTKPGAGRIPKRGG